MSSRHDDHYVGALLHFFNHGTWALSVVIIWKGFKRYGSTHTHTDTQAWILCEPTTTRLYIIYTNYNLYQQKCFLPRKIINILFLLKFCYILYMFVILQPGFSQHHRGSSEKLWPL